MPLPDSFLQELLSRSDIESVISSYVNVKRRGRNLVGLCPFHGEKTHPSPFIRKPLPFTVLAAAPAAM